MQRVRAMTGDGPTRTVPRVAWLLALGLAACASLSGLSGGGDGGGDSGSQTWNLSLVQSSMSGDGPTTFASTGKGDLLVAIGLGVMAPDGTGWRQIAQSAEDEVVLIWPDNPGGLTSFPDQDATVTFMEFAGAPSNVALDVETDTTEFAPGGGSVTIGAKAAEVTGELELLYLAVPLATTATVSTGGWSYVGTDVVGDFAWWRAGTGAADQTTCEIEGTLSLDGGDAGGSCGPGSGGDLDAGESLMFVSLKSL